MTLIVAGATFTGWQIALISLAVFALSLMLFGALVRTRSDRIREAEYNRIVAQVKTHLERFTAKDLAGFQEYYGPDCGFPPEQVIFDVARLVAEVRRLRSLVKRAATTEPGDIVAPTWQDGCWWCGANLERASGPEPHETNCPWLELERENAAQREDEKA